MDCLYCGEKLGLLASKGRQFCNKKHQELWRQREAELSIQRLKDAFGFASSPTAKSKQTSTSVLDPPLGDDLAPAPEFNYEDPHGRALPPATEFTYDDPRDPPVESAGSRAIPEQPVENDGVFYCGPASERETPPNAGFVTVDEPKTTLRVPLYIRRPELAKKSGTEESRSAILALQAVGQRLGQFVEDFSVTPVDVCTVGQPGHSLPKPSSDLQSSELLSKSIQDQIRRLEFQAASAAGETFAFLPFAPAPQLEQARAGVPASEQPVHELPSTSELRPIALHRQDPERAPVFQTISEIIAGSFDRSATAGAQPVASATAPRALPAALERAKPALPPSTFQALSARQSAPFQYTGPATTVFANSAKREFESRLPVWPRGHAFQSPHFPGAFLGKGILVGPKPPEPKANVYGVAEQSFDPRPAGLRLREPLCQPVPAQAREIVPASLPPQSGPAPQAVISAKTPKARELALARPISAPPPNCTFASLATEQKASAQRTAPTVQVCTAWPQYLGSPVQVHARQREIPDSKALRIQAFAPNPEKTETKTPRYVVRPPACEIRPQVLYHRVAQAPPLVLPRPVIIPANIPPLVLAYPQPAALTKPLRALPVAVSLRRPALPYSAFLAQTDGLGVPAEHTRPVTPARANLPNYKLGPKVQIPCRPFDFEPAKVAATALCIASFTAQPEKTRAQAQPASEPVYEPRPQTSELRPLALRRRDEQRRSAFTPLSEIIAPSLPPLVAQYPQAAIRSGQGTPGLVMVRDLPAPPHSIFQVLALGPCSSSPSDRPATLPCPHLPYGDLRAVPVSSRKRAFDAHKAASEALELQIAGISSEQPEARSQAAAYQPVYELRPQAFEVRPMTLGRHGAEREPVVARYPKIILTGSRRSAAQEPQPAIRRSVPALSVAPRNAMCGFVDSAFPTFADAYCAAPTTHTRAATAKLGSRAVALGILARDPQFVVPASIFNAASPALPHSRSAYKPAFFVERSGYSPACPARLVRPARPYVAPAPEPVFFTGLKEVKAALLTAASSSGFVPLTAWTTRTGIGNESALLSRLVRHDTPATPISSLLGATEAKRPDQPAQLSSAMRGRRSIPAGAKRELTWVADKIPWVPRP